MRGTYDNPLVITYPFDAIDFGAGDVTKYIKGPNGMRGRLIDVTFDVDETFNAVTTQGYTRLGLTGDLDAYGEVPMGTSAIDTAYSASGMTGAVIGEDATVIPADTALIATFVAPTGGTPAGIADVRMVIGWYN